MNKARKILLTALVCLTATFGAFGFASCNLLGSTGGVQDSIQPITHQHSYSKKITPPTCTEQGYTTYTCSCGESYEDNYLDAWGHTEVTDKAVNPTCTKTGLTEGKHCSVCKETLVEQEVTPANGHTEVPDKAVNPTCTETGLTAGSHCSVCQTPIVKQETVPANGHNYVDGVCGTCGDLKTKGLKYTLNADGQSYSVTGIGTCTDTDIVIPSRYEEKPVTTIGYEAFRDRTSLTSVVIPNSVTSLSNGWEFFGCTGLKSVVIPDSVTSIGLSTFEGCTGLTSVEIGKGVTSIGYHAFFNCTSLTSINVSISNANYKSIDGSLYTKNEKTLVQYAVGKTDTSFTVPNSVTSISNEAFYGCKNLTSLELGNGVKSIGQNAFYGCSKLTSITVSAGNTTYAAMDGNLYTKDGTKLVQYAVGKTDTSFTVPDTVTSIGDCAFSSCESLTSVDLGNGVKTIGNYVFWGCISLTNVVIGNNVTSIGALAFYNCTNLTSVYYKGTAEDWTKINIISAGNGNTYLTDATRYYYVENGAPNDGGNYWHYVNGVPTKY